MRQPTVDEHEIKLIGGGHDDTLMASQRELVNVRSSFTPKVGRMDEA